MALLQYVANQLKSSESLDLLVLKEMVQTMTVGGWAGGRGGSGRGVVVVLRAWGGAGSGMWLAEAAAAAAAAAALYGPAVGALPRWSTHVPSLPLLPLPALSRTPPSCSPAHRPQGHQAVFEVSEGQLDALSGSDTLKAEVITQVVGQGGGDGAGGRVGSCGVVLHECSAEGRRGAGWRRMINGPGMRRSCSARPQEQEVPQSHARSSCCLHRRPPQGEHRSSDKRLQRASGWMLAALQRGDTPEERLAMPLLVLLCQQRKLIVLQSQVGSGVGGGAGREVCAGEGGGRSAGTSVIACTLVPLRQPPSLLCLPLPPDPSPPDPCSPPT